MSGAVYLQMFIKLTTDLTIAELKTICWADFKHQSTMPSNYSYVHQ